MLFLLFAISSITQSLLIEKTHQVIIIGAGISGLRASEILTFKEIPHIILQSKSRIGGRVSNIILDGILVDEGPSFIKYFNNSSLESLIYKNGWQPEECPLDYNNTFLYIDNSSFTQNQFHQVQNLYKRLSSQIGIQMETKNIDTSLQEIFDQLIQSQLFDSNRSIKNALSWMISTNSDHEGPSSSVISAQAYIQQDHKKYRYPLGGFYKLFQKIFRSNQKNIYLNEKVTSIYYSKDIIIINTTKNSYKTKKVISSLPLGVLKSGRVKFKPALPRDYRKAIKSIGNGIVNKLFVTFNSSFWGDKKNWLHFYNNQEQNRYSTAFILPDVNKNVLVFFLSEQTSVEIEQFNQKEIIHDLTVFLCQHINNTKILIQKVYMTKWHLDQDILGSFSHYKVGTRKDDFHKLNQPINGKIWFVGQHTHAELNGKVQGAYESAQRAVDDLMGHFTIKLKIQYIEQFPPFRSIEYEQQMSQKTYQKLKENRKLFIHS